MVALTVISNTVLIFNLNDKNFDCRINSVLSRFVRNVRMIFICMTVSVLLPVKEVSSRTKKLDNVFNVQWIVLSVIHNKFVSNVQVPYSCCWTGYVLKNALMAFIQIGIWEGVWCAMICVKLAKIRQQIVPPVMKAHSCLIINGKKFNFI